MNLTQIHFLRPGNPAYTGLCLPQTATTSLPNLCWYLYKPAKTILIFCFTFLLLGCAEQKEPSSPNVLFLFADDLNDVVMGGHPQVISPNIDKLMQMGTNFTNAHTNAPLCAPSRASMVTGLMPHTSGYFGGVQYDWRENPKLADAITFMEYFSANGYKVMGTGKIFHHRHPDTTVWINQDGSYLHGHNFSFGPFPWDGKNDKANGWGIKHPDFPSLHTDVLCTSLANVPVIAPDPEQNIPGHAGWRLYYDEFKYNHENDRDLMPDELNAKWAVDQLQQDHDKPFLMCVGFNRPHAPLIAPQKYFDMFPLEDIQLAEAWPNDTADCADILVDSADYGTGAHGYFNYNTINDFDPEGLKKWTQAYLACVAFVDDQIGKILTALENSKYAENTIIVFSSDHGYHMGQKKWLFKNTLWGKATRVPYVWAGPGIQAGATSDVPVSLVDIYPSLVDLCNLSGDPNVNPNQLALDGESLRPLLESADGKLNRDYAVSYVSSGTHKEPKGIIGNYRDHHAAIISDTYRYIRCYNGEEELYNFRKDPMERVNLVFNDENHSVLTTMRQQYEVLDEKDAPEAELAKSIK